MKKIPFRAVIVDFDRTLLHTDKSISDYTIQVLHECQRSGIRLFAATARPERAIAAYQETVAFDAVTTLNGARTITGSRVFEHTISANSADMVLSRLCETAGTVISAETAGGLYASTDIPVWSPVVMEDIRILVRSERIYKILASHPEIPADRILTDLPGDTYSTVADGKLLQVMDRAATKWNGIQNMLEAYRIPIEQAVYFGDDNDDIEPILRCGCGVAVSNALEAVRKAADYVTGSNDEDGVAVFLSGLLKSGG